ncbi:hypothetical protein GCM10010365_19460 [Streptomyces poonensis]|uniref:Luciferase-like domain-containing protein n=1 Tax=Streptomyces poonensis TaxID=68255 RepID=A0A918PCY1_9ACTN|nr:hypothetical protein GCM10010365_19460 [Streptomyces poonensis]GLJ90440.1 hypothetical protein GCM10017589_30430 [Streptomyces poonensis]
MPAAPLSVQPLEFACWVPHVSGGLGTSKIEQRTDRSYDYNRELAVLAENNGFDYALTQVRCSSTSTATSPPSSGRPRPSPTPSPPRDRGCTTTPTP